MTTETFVPILAFLGLILVLVIASLVERIKDQRPANLKPSTDWQLTEYHGGHRDHLGVFDGIGLDGFESSHFEAAMLERAASLVEQRRSGRWPGPVVTVSWHPGRDSEADKLAAWINENGGHQGVFIKRLT